MTGSSYGCLGASVSSALHNCAKLFQGFPYRRYMRAQIEGNTETLGTSWHTPLFGMLKPVFGVFSEKGQNLFLAR